MEIVGPVLTYGAIVTVIGIIVSLGLVKASPKAAYLPGVILAIIGLLSMFASPLANTELMGAPLGGLGIASMFASALTFIFTSIFDAYQQPNTNRA